MTSGCENQHRMACERLTHSVLKGPVHTHLLINSLTLSCRARAAAKEISETYEENVNLLALVKGWRVRVRGQGNSLGRGREGKCWQGKREPNLLWINLANTDGPIW